MFRNALSLVLITITGLVHLGTHMQAGKTIRSPSTRSLRIDPMSDSTSGISFRSLVTDRSGGLWLGGSVFGVEGLLLNSRGQMTKAHTVSAVEFIQDLSFTNMRNGWMVADGLLYHTRDAGRSWQRVKPIDREGALKTVCFINSSVGWVAGKSGVVIRTMNGGVTWRKVDSDAEFTIERIRFVSRDKGWAMGLDISPPETKRILLLTSDGGLTWRKAPGSDTQQFASVIFVNSHLGWAINSKDQILQSVDGGETWTVQRPRDGTGWTSVFFVNESDGWAAGNGIIHTTDGGKTWKYQLRTSGSAEESLDEIMFAGRRTGAVIGLTRVLVTYDSGGAWRPLSDSWKSGVISRVRREKFKSASSK